MKKKESTLTVVEYIASCPKEVQGILRKIRAAIKEAAPRAKERTDYFNWPGYSYEGYDYDGMFAWFSYKKPFVRVHIRPPAIQKYKKDLVGCKISTGIVAFPEDKKIPLVMIKKLVKASVQSMKDGKKK